MHSASLHWLMRRVGRCYRVSARWCRRTPSLSPQGAWGRGDGETPPPPRTDAGKGTCTLHELFNRETAVANVLACSSVIKRKTKAAHYLPICCTKTELWISSCSNAAVPVTHITNTTNPRGDSRRTGLERPSDHRSR